MISCGSRRYIVGKDAVQYRSAFFITALTASECCCQNTAAIFRAASSALSPVSFSILFAVFIESAVFWITDLLGDESLHLQGIFSLFQSGCSRSVEESILQKIKDLEKNNIDSSTHNDV